MQELTATEVSKTLGLSTRMLRYYEKAGLITAMRKDDYAYRCYDEFTKRRLQQILVLRKLRIPLKHIAVILDDGKQQKAYEIMQEQLKEVTDEISALELIRTVLQTFVSQLDESIRTRTQVTLLGDTTLKEIADTLVLPKSALKEPKMSLSDLDKAEETLTGDLRIRFVVLPPMTVASSHFIGENPEENAIKGIESFVQETGLYEKKPDARLFGFNNPSPSPSQQFYGYEYNVTIPEDMNVPTPLVKKQLSGGLYAALTIDFPNFHEWELLNKWLENSEEWEINYAPEGAEIMFGGLEEHLNWVYMIHHGWPEDGLPKKIDLLLPIKKKKK